ncbi:hypothetical protein E3Q02_01441 [Wallemia mellicola]|uniref:Uncharacterized protein n=1 Tax=Wallemia mellicola TaxID=1708541 RepID=A0AB38MY99_9BASI|nr:hypothetical protein E3Q02_01441 [Wallemia mellicola]
MAHLRRPSIDSSVSHESFAARIGGKFRDAITPNISHDDQDDSSDKRGRSFFSRGRDNRSESRGRDPIVSTGRGGAGNLRASSKTRAAYESDAQDERRGRSSHATPPKAVHAGRGGVGNVRSPSRDPKDIRNQQAEHQLEAKLQREAQEKAERDGVIPTGRGGAGNIRHNEHSQSRSRSRSRTRDLLQRATSRDRSSSRDTQAIYNNSTNNSVAHDVHDPDNSLAAVRE